MGSNHRWWSLSKAILAAKLQPTRGLCQSFLAANRALCGPYAMRLGNRHSRWLATHRNYYMYVYWSMWYQLAVTCKHVCKITFSTNTFRQNYFCYRVTSEGARLVALASGIYRFTVSRCNRGTREDWYTRQFFSLWAHLCHIAWLQFNPPLCTQDMHDKCIDWGHSCKRQGS